MIMSKLCTEYRYEYKSKMDVFRSAFSSNKKFVTFWKIVVVCLFWSEMSLGFERYQEVLRLARRNKFLGVKGFCFYYILKAISWAQHNIEELPPPRGYRPAKDQVITHF